MDLKRKNVMGRAKGAYVVRELSQPFIWTCESEQDSGPNYIGYSFFESLDNADKTWTVYHAICAHRRTDRENRQYDSCSFCDESGPQVTTWDYYCRRGQLISGEISFTGSQRNRDVLPLAYFCRSSSLLRKVSTAVLWYSGFKMSSTVVWVLWNDQWTQSACGIAPQVLKRQLRRGFSSNFLRCRKPTNYVRYQTRSSLRLETNLPVRLPNPSSPRRCNEWSRSINSIWTRMHGSSTRPKHPNVSNVWFSPKWWTTDEVCLRRI